MPSSLESHPVSSAGVQLKEATLATHYVPSHLLPELESELQQLGTRASSRKAVHELLAKFEVGLEIVVESVLCQTGWLWCGQAACRGVTLAMLGMVAL